MVDPPASARPDRATGAGWLDGVVALITGGGNGIGRAVVERYLAEGAKVGILDRDVREVERMNREYGGNVVAVAGDVVSVDDHKRALAAVLDAFGRLDVFVGNAGIFDFFKRFEDLDCETLLRGFDEIFATNVKGYLIGARLTAEALRESGGSMIFTVSNSGLYAGGGGVLYVASKHAIVGLVRQLAFELAPDVRVNGVAPGGTMTDLQGPVALNQAHRRLRDLEGLESTVAKSVPLALMSRPEDHAGIYVLLASKRNSRATTGAIIPSDGGMEVRGDARPKRRPVERP